MKQINLFLLLLFFGEAYELHSSNPQVIINTSIVSKDTIRNELFGGFIELLGHFVNGHEGQWSQEILDRGFDINGIEVSQFWTKFSDNLSGEQTWSLDTGGYNPNGLFSQRLDKSNSIGEMGISQKVYLNDSVGHVFYIYCKGDLSEDSVFVSIRDSISEKIYYKKGIGVPNSNWEKHTIYIPPILKVHFAQIVISITSEGYVLFDESSLMPENNVFGMRKEFYDLYKNWKPGILRYPGGCFADQPANKLSNSTGDIDKRKSPNIVYGNSNQRMDFGVDEFVAVCKSIGIEPDITLNFASGTAEEAANYLDYCNGSNTTQYGSLRSKFGHTEPYGIKYWEVGNEQWTNDSAYATRYLEYYEIMKKRDSCIQIIISGNHWIHYENFEALFSIVGKKCDIYSYHPAICILPKGNYTDEEVYFSALTSSHIYKTIYFDSVDNWLRQWKLCPEVKQGIPEWWTNYGDGYDWLLDTNVRTYSLESGLVGASMLNQIMRYPETIVIGGRTCGLGLLRFITKENTGERFSFASPTYYALLMLRNHHGLKVIQSNVFCDTYSPKDIPGIWSIENTPYIDATVTASEDTLYINLLSRYINESKDIDLVIDKDIIGSQSVVYELYSDSYLDANTSETPTKVVPKQKSWTVTNTYTMPPHSFTILAIPCSGIINVDESSVKKEFEYSVYPNPVNDILHIEANEELGNVKIYNILGSLVFDEIIYYKQSRINLELLPSGLYICDIRNCRRLFVRK
ncbi:MAG: T9SS type A sorting domain-containing protein [bacterium]